MKKQAQRLIPERNKKSGRISMANIWNWLIEQILYKVKFDDQIASDIHASEDISKDWSGHQ